MVEFCSVDIAVRVWRYLSCRACGDCSITSAAAFKAPEDFCSPSAAMTLARASLAASASAAMALWSCKGSLTSLISTLSTFTPQGSVVSSRELCMLSDIFSRSDRISARFLVPRTFLRVVAASSCVEWLAVRCLLVSDNFLHLLLHLPEI